VSVRREGNRSAAIGSLVPLSAVAVVATTSTASPTSTATSATAFRLQEEEGGEVKFEDGSSKIREDNGKDRSYLVIFLRPVSVSVAIPSTLVTSCSIAIPCPLVRASAPTAAPSSPALGGLRFGLGGGLVAPLGGRLAFLLSDLLGVIVIVSDNSAAFGFLAKHGGRSLDGHGEGLTEVDGNSSAHRNGVFQGGSDGALEGVELMEHGFGHRWDSFEVPLRNTPEISNSSEQGLRVRVRYQNPLHREQHAAEQKNVLLQAGILGLDLMSDPKKAKSGDSNRNINQRRNKEGWCYWPTANPSVLQPAQKVWSSDSLRRDSSGSNSWAGKRRPKPERFLATVSGGSAYSVQSAASSSSAFRRLE
jgi:hypothetical protein